MYLKYFYVCITYYLFASGSEIPSMSGYDTGHLEHAVTSLVEYPQVSLSHNILDFKKLYLNVNVPELEKFDFEHSLTNSMKEQLIIYNLFVEKLLWLGYRNCNSFREGIDFIAGVLKLKDQNCLFARHYNLLLLEGCSDIFYFFDENSCNVEEHLDLCKIERENGKIYYIQKDLSEELFHRKLLKITSEYYKKRFYKTFYLPNEAGSYLKSEIRALLSNPENVDFLGSVVSCKAFDNLVNLCVFSIIYNMSCIPDRVLNDIECVLL